MSENIIISIPFSDSIPQTTSSNFEFKIVIIKWRTLEATEIVVTKNMTFENIEAEIIEAFFNMQSLFALYYLPSSALWETEKELVASYEKFWECMEVMLPISSKRNPPMFYWEASVSFPENPPRFSAKALENFLGREKVIPTVDDPGELHALVSLRLSRKSTNSESVKSDRLHSNSHDSNPDDRNGTDPHKRYMTGKMDTNLVCDLDGDMVHDYEDPYMIVKSGSRSSPHAAQTHTAAPSTPRNASCKISSHGVDKPAVNGNTSTIATSPNNSSSKSVHISRSWFSSWCF